MIYAIIIILAVGGACFYLIRKHVKQKRCNWCNSRSRVNKNGICEVCVNRVQIREKGRIERINANYQIIDSGRELHIRIAKLNETLDELKKLFPYEDKGLELLKPSAHKRFFELKEKHDRIIFDAARDSMIKLKTKIKKNSSVQDKLDFFNQALLYVVDLKLQLVVHHDILNDIEEDIKHDILKLNVRNLVMNGVNYEKKGDRENAILSYQKATKYIRENDNSEILKTDLTNISNRLKKIAA